MNTNNLPFFANNRRVLCFEK